jgi:tetratricopeptide (TPR) repeat protein
LVLSNLGRYEEAITAYDAALAIKPDKHEALIARGQSNMFLGSIEQAQSDLGHAAKLRPNDPTVSMMSAFSNLMNRQGDTDKQVDLAEFMQAISSPGLLEQLQAQLTSTGQQLSLEQQIQRAQTVANALGLSANDFQVQLEQYRADPVSQIQALQAAQLLFKANSALEQEKYEEAVAAYDAALAIKPDDPDILGNKGIALRRLERIEEAIAAYDAALALKPDDPGALYNKGNALDELGRYEDAIAAYDAALALKPDLHEALYNKGNALVNLGRYEDAIAAYDAALAIKPDDPGALYNKACIYGLQGKVEPTLENLATAIQLNPDNYREMATTDSDFDAIRHDPRFQTLLTERLE